MIGFRFYRSVFKARRGEKQNGIVYLPSSYKCFVETNDPRVISTPPTASTRPRYLSHVILTLLVVICACDSTFLMCRVVYLARILMNCSSR